MADVDTARSLSGAIRVYVIEAKYPPGFPSSHVYATLVLPAPRIYGPGWWYVYLEGDDSGRPLIARIAI